MSIIADLKVKIKIRADGDIELNVKEQKQHDNNKIIRIKCGNSQHRGLFKGTSYSESEFLQQPFPSAISNQFDYFRLSYIKYNILQLKASLIRQGDPAEIIQRQAISTPKAFHVLNNCLCLILQGGGIDFNNNIFQTTTIT